jgi:hypothetical protein
VKFTPCDGQIEAIRTLAFDQLDLILIVPTGWGKSAVFQAIPALRDRICLMIMLLNLLEEGQVSKDSYCQSRTLGLPSPRMQRRRRQPFGEYC